MEEIHREWEGAIELGRKFVFSLEELRSMRGTIQKDGGTTATRQQTRGGDRGA